MRTVLINAHKGGENDRCLPIRYCLGNSLNSVLAMGMAYFGFPGLFVWILLKVLMFKMRNVRAIEKKAHICFHSNVLVPS